MRTLSRILGYSWKYLVFTVILFIVFWHLLSVRNAVKTAEDKFHTALEQNVVNLETSFLNNNAVEFQKILWQIKNDNILNMKFFPTEKRPGGWMFKEVVVGELLNRNSGVLGKSTKVISNGAELGRLEYSIDLVNVNASVFEQNHALFITVVFFFLGLLVISNLGAIQTLLAIERSVNEINAITASGQSDIIRDSIKKNISSLPAGIIGTPFAQMTGRMSDALGQAARLESELAVSKAVSDIAAQVAHDIRSPLAALGAAASGLELLPAEQRSLIEGSVNRMQGIADDLLQRYRAPSAGPGKVKALVCALAGLIEQVIAEKRLQHKDKTVVKIEFAGASGEIKAMVEPKELQRLLSNLVNNSVEAFAGPGTVSVVLSALDGKALIEVKDNGKGIPAGILAKLGQKGETHGKAGGTGLGLYHARTTVEGWGGSFKIGSEPGKGTTVLIELPRAAASAGRMAVLLDDDLLVHMNWKLAAKTAGVELKVYKTPEDFAAAIETLSKDALIYIDSDLAGDIKGENIAKDLYEKGFTAISMGTGHSPEKFTHLPWLKVTGKEPPWA